jgi:hypothetical protein
VLCERVEARGANSKPRIGEKASHITGFRGRAFAADGGLGMIDLVELAFGLFSPPMNPEQKSAYLA